MPEPKQPISGECWWEIRHLGHFAWHQRAMMKGDFRPGLQPRGDYVVDAEGRAADPMVTPSCETCGTIPDVNDLEPIERVTGKSGFLDDVRSGRRPWPAPTNPHTCWYCNGRETADPVRVAAASQVQRRNAAAAIRAKALGRDAPPAVEPDIKEELFLCARCTAHLQRS